nr:IS66 family insertion sequence element accessory protein TnpB [Mesorhizobium sp.]
MNDARNFHVIDAVPDRLKVSPPRSHRRWSEEAKARLIEASLAPGANVSAIAREAGLAPSQLFGWRRKALKGDAENRRGGEGRLGFVEIATTAAQVENRGRRNDHSRRRRHRPGPVGQDHPVSEVGMIPAGVKVLLASHPVGFRKGPDGLLALVRDAGSDPFNGSLYVFRAKRADRIKIVWWDGSGVCLHVKRLEKSKFCWPGSDRTGFS